VLNTINVASSGLAVAREQVENVMNNTANENTPGYKKRVVGVSEASHIDARLTGRGALVGDTTRVTNVYLYDNLTSEKSKKSQHDELSMMLADVEAIVYETEDSGFSSDLDRYFQAVENLRSDPNNEVYRNDLRNTGKAIVDDLKTLYSDLEKREGAALNTVDDNVEELNTILTDIGSVNKRLTDTGIISNDLLDKRDELEQEIAQYIDIDIDRRNNYELKISDMTAVRFDNNIHEVRLETSEIAQRDVYADAGHPNTSNLINLSTWEDTGDKVTFKLNNTDSISVEYDEVILDSNGVKVDLDHDGNNTNDAVTKDNIIKAVMYKINHTPEIAGRVTAYNGEYILDKHGEKILTDNPKHPEYDPANPYKDRYLVIEADTKGDVGKFDGRIIVEDADATEPAVNLKKSSELSIKGADDVHLEIFDRTLSLKSGKLKPLLENLDTNSPNNLFVKYKENLDHIAKALSDMSESYIENDDGSYISGTTAVDIHKDRDKRVDIGLFSGGNVDTLKFNDGLVSGLSQDDLDYLATLQWNTDIDIDESGQNLTSFSKFNQTSRVQISEDKETVDFKKDTQDAVTNSLQNSYDKLVKVDKDEEMMNLIKFQSAYEANAKLITIIDEMLATILGMKK